MPNRTFSVFDGAAFVVSNGLGDIDPAPAQPHGFFRDDTRFLSCWQLTLRGQALASLSVAGVEYYAVEFFLVPPARSIYENPSLSVMRRRVVRGSWTEEIAVMNHRHEPVELELSLTADADFADIFEVKDGAVRPRDIEREWEDGTLRLTYRRGDFLRETRIVPHDGEWEGHAGGLRSQISLAPREERWITLEILPRAHRDGESRPSARAASFEETRAGLRTSLQQWLSEVPQLETDWGLLRHAYWRGLVDLAALRCHPESAAGGALPAAGLPWFMALFGRDSLITSYQVMPMRPDLVRNTLVALAGYQAKEIDEFRDAEPGKILHELRAGELTVFGERPHSPYYGTADATPLFLVVLDEYERWTGDASLVRELEPNARAALEWIDRHGDRDGDGFVEYKRRNEETGLENQCWKDSWNSILFADGTVAEAPIATCEIQGYVYAAKRRCARLARAIWGDPDLADRLEREAAGLRHRFHEQFWVDDGGYYALALDRDKRKVDSLTSNLGHLLWSEIVDPGPAAMLAEHLMADSLFSGWGVRTMSTGDTGYSPIEYHNGTVWPHDNSLIAEGLRAYGFREQANRIGVALLEAGARFNHRPPEVFAGYPRELTQFPVEYPTASRPQAWATGAPLLFVRTLLGLEPSGNALAVDACLPERVDLVALRQVPGRWGRADAVATQRQPKREAFETWG